MFGIHAGYKGRSWVVGGALAFGTISGEADYDECGDADADVDDDDDIWTKVDQATAKALHRGNRRLCTNTSIK